MTAPAAKPLLELTTLDPIDRPFITIDDTPYPIKGAADFSLMSLNKLDQMSERVTALQSRNLEKAAASALTDEDAAELTDALKVVVAQIVDAPPEVLDRLKDLQRLQVLTAFMPASPETAAAKPNRTARRRTGASSSRASRASTAPAAG